MAKKKETKVPKAPAMVGAHPDNVRTKTQNLSEMESTGGPVGQGLSSLPIAKDMIIEVPEQGKFKLTEKHPEWPGRSCDYCAFGAKYKCGSLDPSVRCITPDCNGDLYFREFKGKSTAVNG